MVSNQVYLDVLSYFHFWPSKALAIVGLVVFLVLSLTVAAMTIRTRTWYMSIAAIVGLLEMAGYACRIAMLNKPQYGVYVAMQCFLIIPPSFLALVQYVTLGKVIKVIKEFKPESKLLVKPKAVIWGYFLLELASLAAQGAGAGLSVSNDGPPKSANVGKTLLLIGLAVLVALIVCYMLTAIYVHVSPAYGIRKSRSLGLLFIVLYVSTALLLTRNIFRLIEFAQGFYGPLVVNSEAYFYCLDALMIALILVCYTIFHYGIFFNGYRRENQIPISGQLPLGSTATVHKAGGNPRKERKIEVI